MNLPPRIQRWEPSFTCAGELTGLQPELIAAVCDRETLGGIVLVPAGAAGTGDGGHGRGLMQWDDREHPLLCAWRLASDDLTPAWHLAEVNILGGAALLANGICYFDGDVAAGVAAYNASRERVRAVVAQLPADASFVDRVNALDLVTTGRNYVSDVLSRRDRFLQPTTPPAAPAQPKEQ